MATTLTGAESVEWNLDDLYDGPEAQRLMNAVTMFFSVALISALADDFLTKFALEHQVIIQQFGRFPHRNSILGRESTLEEVEFLKEDGSRF